AEGDYNVRVDRADFIEQHFNVSSELPPNIPPTLSRWHTGNALGLGAEDGVNPIDLSVKDVENWCIALVNTDLAKHRAEDISSLKGTTLAQCLGDDYDFTHGLFSRRIALNRIM